MAVAPTRKLELGYRAQQAGELDKAERLYRQALALDPRNQHALNLLGVLCVNGQRPREAVGFIAKVLQADPTDAQAHANIGLAYKDLGMAGKAAGHLRESVRLVPGNPVVFNNLGNVLRLLDQPHEAIRAYDRALRLQPGFAECWSNLAAALNESGQYEPGLKAAAKALELDPQLAQAHNNQGDIHLQQAQYEDALRCYRQAVALRPGYLTALINLARTQRDMDLPEQAVATLRRAFKAAPGNADAHHAMGVLLEQMGDRDGAAQQFQAAIQAAPDMAIAHYYLAQISGRRSSEQEFAAVRSLLAEEDLTPNNRMYLSFALSRIHEQRGDAEAAYRHLAAANKAKADARPYDDAQAAKYMDAILAATEAAIERLGRRPGHADQRPVFVLGMPRSGTSLTEQILASHSAAAGAGELSYAFDAMRQVRELTGLSFPEGLARLSAAQFRAMGEHYLSRHSPAHLAARRIVDKSPLNFQYVGPLALMLPGARFIHCHRQPVANCFAIHRIPFDLRQTYAHSLAGLGRYYSRYWSLMQGWKALFADRILDVRYEDTVADVEGQARRMLDFLGLPFEDQVLDFHKTERLVKTPSASQVREPIYQDAVDAWRKHEKHLGPLIENLPASLRPAQSGG